MDESDKCGEKTCTKDEDEKNDTNGCSSNTSMRSPAGLRPSSVLPSSSHNPEIRRSNVKELIERYFYQLQRGCGNVFCMNESCASSGLLEPLSPNEAAAKALQLFTQDAPFCEAYNQAPKTHCAQASEQSAPIQRILTHQQSSDTLLPAQISFNSSTHTPNISPTGTSGSSTIGTTETSLAQSNQSQPDADAMNGEPYLRLAYDSGQESANSSPERHARPSNTNDNAEGRNRVSAFLYDSDSSSDHLSEIPLPDSEPDVSKEETLDDTEMYTRFPPVHFLNEKIVDDLIEKGKRDGKYEQLLNAIGEVYSCVDKLSQSFRRPTNVILNQLTSSSNAAKLQEILGKSPCDLKKEDLRSLEGETEKDEDSSCTAADGPSMDVDEPATPSTRQGATAASVSDDSEDDDMATVIASGSCKSSKDFIHLKNTSDMLVDLESLRRVKKKLFALNETTIAETLNSNIVLLSETIKYQYNQWDWEQVLHCIIICFDMITNISNSLMDFEFLERSLPKLCQAVRVMPIVPQARLTRVWSVHCKDQLHSLVQCCQQLISLHVIMMDVAVQENAEVIAATKVLKIAYYSSILAGESDPPRNPVVNEVRATYLEGSLVMQHDAEDELFLLNTETSSSSSAPLYPRYADDDLAKELNLRALYCRDPVVPFDEFYNEPLSDNIRMDRDYLCYKKLSLDPSSEETNFSFMLYSFILTPATKVVGLYYDSRIRMYSERHTSIYSILSLYNGEGNELNAAPDLKLKVRRDNIVLDSLVGLEIVAMSNPKDLKKQLVIEFVGEQGIDEGGVSKEFFQLIVEEIFNVDFGMFVELEETDAFWFNIQSFENDAQFTLIGIIIGLAIYNNIILAVRFPMVVYRKLMGADGTFSDLKDFNPTLFRSLKSLLEYEDEDMEEVFMQTFKISYKNVFGEVMEHELLSGGADILVGQHNKQDFVDLYADFLLNTSIHRQFEAFKKGFEMVTDESPLRLLFRPEEIELLVCGSRKFDFVELEKSTEYDGGYTKDTQIIKDFWEIVHSMPEESKRKLLEFTTGSDRVPVGGLSRLKLLITRHGPDCDRLPTSHTCFNILLLPEYTSKQKLEERLLKAITYSKGFGML